METRKVIVKESDVAIISCPFCRETKKMSVGKYRETGKRQLKVKCSCNKIFEISLECRRHDRKITKILGKSINLSSHREMQDIIIENISSSGIGFCPSKKHKTRKDDRLQVSFLLNDIQQTLINTHVTVQSATSEYVGCEFNSTEKFKTSLGFYLIG